MDSVEYSVGITIKVILGTVFLCAKKYLRNQVYDERKEYYVETLVKYM